jgi:hypothetical protein
MPLPADFLTAKSTADAVRQMAAEHRVRYVPTQSDRLADQITRLSSDTVELDEIEYLLVALQRAGHISREQLIQLQARYLREINP